MRKSTLLAGTLLTLFMVLPMRANSQGEQILDGIGETALIARYTLTEDVKDNSRNNLHGKIQGTGFSFVNDDQFGKTLSLNGGSDTYISLPGAALAGKESLTISGWIYLKSEKSGQPVFTFGKNGSTKLILSTSVSGEKVGLSAQIQTKTDKYSLETAMVALYKWSHWAIVIDIPAQKFTFYLNGFHVDQAVLKTLDLPQIFDQTDTEKNKLYIGSSEKTGNVSFNGYLHDFRLYRIPLKETQVKNIYKNALAKNRDEANVEDKVNSEYQHFSSFKPQLYAAYLTKVPDIVVETTVGNLPELPRFVEGEFSENMDIDNVRVIWPAPKNNTQVQLPGTYMVTGKIAGSDIQPKAVVTVKDEKVPASPKRVLEEFKLGQVQLKLDSHAYTSKFQENRDKFMAGLLNTNPDDFLYMFRNAFGQPQPTGAKPLGVWDSQETKLRGHATGHYLSALAQAYASTSYDVDLQVKFAEKMNYLVNTLYKLSNLSGQPGVNNKSNIVDPRLVPYGPGKAGYNSNLSEIGIRNDYWSWGEGYISAYPPDQFIMLENGASYRHDSTGIWAPYYTLHKILAGLLDVYEVSRNEKALDIVVGMGNWVDARLSELPSDTLVSMWNRYIAGEFGGMNEVLARLSRLTNEPRYLETAQLFDNITMFFGDSEHAHGLAKNVDTFRGLHANQHIPQVIGALEMYGDGKGSQYYHIAENFWNKATGDYMYSIGGVAGARNPANAECFLAEPATLYKNGFAPGGQNETCATYNLLKLTRNLFLYSQKPELMDYYERGLFNHILASVAKDSPANTYHVPLNAGAVKHFSNANMDGFTCCNGTALESNTKLQNTIYFKSADNAAVYINLFIPSTLNWTEKKVVLTQTTAFPKENYTSLSIGGKGKFDIKVRVPNWAKKGFKVTINGVEEQVQAVPGTYLSLHRKWKDGDKIEITMPFSFYLEPLMDQQNISSLFYGPVLLAVQESEPRKEWRKLILDAQDLSNSIQGDPGKLEFTIGGLVLKPFYESYGRYSVYFDVTLQ